jgi:hypothetical protein
VLRIRDWMNNPDHTFRWAKILKFFDGDPGWKKSDPVQTSRIRNTGFDKMPKLKRSSIPSQHVYLKSLRKHLLATVLLVAEKNHKLTEIRTTDRKT